MEEVVAEFEVHSRIWRELLIKPRKLNQSRQSVSKPRFKSGTSETEIGVNLLHVEYIIRIGK